MTDNSIGKTAAGSVPPFLVELAKNAPAMMWVFTSTIFLSALLLFAIQPMFAKMALPVLGGSPSVWSVSVFFFQAALLVGYLYAHLLINKVPSHLTGIVHLGVCALALLSLPIGMATWVGEPPQGEPYLWQLGMFTASIGLPFMAVSANAPLLQAWFARSGHPDARDPYFLYAASNLGSLIALLGYPIVLEPTFGVSQLSHLWAYAYVLLVLAIGGSFFLMRGAQAGGVPETAAAPAGEADTAAAAPTLGKRLSWIGLAFVPAALMTAFTVQTTTDVASAPLLWVIPLALYLLTFVLVFRDRPLISREALLFLHLIALAVVLFSLSQARQQQLVRDQRHRPRGVLHHGDAGAPHALRGAAGAGLPDRVLSVDVVRRRAGRHVHGAGGAQAVQRGLRVSAAARPLDGLPAGRAQPAQGQGEAEG